MNTFGQAVPVRNKKGDVVAHRPGVASRLSRNELPKIFGADSGRKLVVSLCDGDIIHVRPLGIRRPEAVVTITAIDLYTILVCRAASRAALERAREKKLTRIRHSFKLSQRWMDGMKLLNKAI